MGDTASGQAAGRLLGDTDIREESLDIIRCTGEW